ncbi:uncharacterized protein LOC124172342 [Ischnura elegans]|uniref:uncharacterized protein LOC124172342 n=1 Tax=Ischnura elegans TaxID=197161 RepID=UPI001ED88BA1|nr:uncharacterized protein LOC124172342 [Ischnura elegans]
MYLQLPRCIAISYFSDTLLELRAAIKKSRVPVTKIRFSDEESVTDDEDLATSRKSVKDVQAVKKLRTSEVATESFREILKEKKKELKKNSSFSRPKSSKFYIAENTSDEEDGRTASGELEVKYSKMMLAYRKKASEAIEAKEEVKMLQDKLSKQEEELQTLRKLNIELQQALLGKLGAAPVPSTPPRDAMPIDVPSTHSTRQRLH